MTRLQYPCSTPTSIVREFIGDLKLWRRGWDSNPRYGFPYARFRGEYFQPLSHLSAVLASSILARLRATNHAANHADETDNIVMRLKMAKPEKDDLVLIRWLAAGGEEGLKQRSALGGE